MQANWILELNSLEAYPSSEEKENFFVSFFTSSIKSEISHFYIVALKSRQRNVREKCALQSWVFVLPIAFLKSLLSSSLTATVKNDVGEYKYYVFIWNLRYTTVDVKTYWAFI